MRSDIVSKQFAPTPRTDPLIFEHLKTVLAE
jgi:hypothetical protein